MNVVSPTACTVLSIFCMYIAESTCSDCSVHTKQSNPRSSPTIHCPKMTALSGRLSVVKTNTVLITTTRGRTQKYETEVAPHLPKGMFLTPKWDAQRLRGSMWMLTWPRSGCNKSAPSVQISFVWRQRS